MAQAVWQQGVAPVFPVALLWLTPNAQGVGSTSGAREHVLSACNQEIGRIPQSAVLCCNVPLCVSSAEFNTHVLKAGSVYGYWNVRWSGSWWVKMKAFRLNKQTPRSVFIYIKINMFMFMFTFSCWGAGNVNWKWAALTEQRILEKWYHQVGRTAWSTATVYISEAKLW